MSELSNECNLPLDVENEEQIVRVIMSPVHVKAGKSNLQISAFKSAKGLDAISVIRHTWMGSNFCKIKGREIAEGSKTSSLPKKFEGLAVSLAQNIRSMGSSVYDFRDDFCGHAHISHGFIQPEEPLDPIAIEQMNEHIRTVKNTFTYYNDTDPLVESWTGSEIVPN